MADYTCVLCRVYRPDGDPRYAETACRADQLRLERDLLAIPGLFQRVLDGDQADADSRWFETVDDSGAGTGQLRRRDPVAGLLPAGNIRAREHRPRVTGSRQAPLPINVDAVDLTSPFRAGAATADPRDQIGFLPVATVLNAWVRHVRDSLRPDFTLPHADVPHLVGFLQQQLPDLITERPGLLPQLAADLRDLGNAMRHILGDVDPPPQPLLGVRCQHCKTMSALVPWPTGEYVECRSCGQLYNPADRVALAKQQVEELNRPRHVTVDGRLPALLDSLRGVARVAM